MPSLALTYNFSAEIGSVLDKTFTWDSPAESVEDFTATGSEVNFNLLHNVSFYYNSSGSKVYLIKAYVNGAETTSLTVQDDLVWLTQPPQAGDLVRFEYRYSSLVDLSTYTAKMQIRDSAGTLICELSTANGKITFPSTGKIRILVQVAETELWAVGTYFYDLELTTASTYTTRLLQGKIKTKKNVTTS